jgi:GH35 family endo-1,4-beta-xylanase
LLTACAVAASLAGVPAAAAEQSSLRDLAVAHGKDFGSAADNAPHAADPDAKLYINDRNTEGLGAKSNPTYDLVSELVVEGVPIDGAGFQRHLAVQYGFRGGMRQNLQRFADLRLDVAVTEPDVRILSTVQVRHWFTGDNGAASNAHGATGPRSAAPPSPTGWPP